MRPDLCVGATGTDTGGSIRQPAAFCGIVGMKPTYGRCSRWGIVAFASSLDQAGPFARTVRDCAILLRSMAGHDPKDTTCVDLPVPDYEKSVGGSVKGMRIGIPKEYRMPGMAAEIEALWQQGAQWLKDAGAELVDISLPMTKYALPAYYIVAPAEASSNLARYDGVRYGLRVPGRDVIDMYERTRAAGFGKEVRRRIMIGTYVLSAGYYDAYYLQAQKVRTLIKRDFEKCFADGIDAILTPTTPSAAFAIGEKGRADPDRNVSQRRVHGDREYGRAAGHFGAERTRRPRPAARPAIDRPAVRGRDAVRARRGDRAGGRTFHALAVVAMILAHAFFRLRRLGCGRRLWRGAYRFAAAARQRIGMFALKKADEFFAQFGAQVRRFAAVSALTRTRSSIACGLVLVTCTLITLPPATWIARRSRSPFGG